MGTKFKKNANLFWQTSLYPRETAELGSHFWLVRFFFVTLPANVRPEVAKAIILPSVEVSKSAVRGGNLSNLHN